MTVQSAHSGTKLLVAAGPHFLWQDVRLPWLAQKWFIDDLLYNPMVRWMCNVNVKDRVPSKELRERLGIDDIILILQQNRLQWYGHVLQNEDTD